MRGKPMPTGSFLRQEGTCINYLFQEFNLFLQLRCFFVASGYKPVTGEEHFSHPSPMLNRVFLFTRGGCMVETEKTTIRLDARRIHLLPVGLSFEVTYLPDSVFYFFHVNVLDGSGTEMFRETPGVQTLEDEYLFDSIVSGYEMPEVEAQFGWQPLLFHTLIRFLKEKIRQYSRSMHLTEKYVDLFSYIQENCSATLKTGDLAERMGLSRTVLSKDFHRNVGIPLKTYVTMKVMQKARDMLTNPDSQIGEVASRLGYDDPYYFSKVFKKHTGMTPVTYKNNGKLLALIAAGDTRSREGVGFRL